MLDPHKPPPLSVRPRPVSADPRIGAGFPPSLTGSRPFGRTISVPSQMFNVPSSPAQPYAPVRASGIFAGKLFLVVTEMFDPLEAWLITQAISAHGGVIIYEAHKAVEYIILPTDRQQVSNELTNRVLVAFQGLVPFVTTNWVRASVSSGELEPLPAGHGWADHVENGQRFTVLHNLLSRVAQEKETLARFPPSPSRIHKLMSTVGNGSSRLTTHVEETEPERQPQPQPEPKPGSFPKPRSGNWADWEDSDEEFAFNSTPSFKMTEGPSPNPSSSNSIPRPEPRPYGDLGLGHPSIPPSGPAPSTTIAPPPGFQPLPPTAADPHEPPSSAPVPPPPSPAPYPFEGADVPFRAVTISCVAEAQKLEDHVTAAAILFNHKEDHHPSPPFPEARTVTAPATVPTTWGGPLRVSDGPSHVSDMAADTSEDTIVADTSLAPEGMGVLTGQDAPTKVEDAPTVSGSASDVTASPKPKRKSKRRSKKRKSATPPPQSSPEPPASPTAQPSETPPAVSEPITPYWMPLENQDLPSAINGTDLPKHVTTRDSAVLLSSSGDAPKTTPQVSTPTVPGSPTGSESVTVYTEVATPMVPQSDQPSPVQEVILPVTSLLASGNASDAGPPTEAKPPPPKLSRKEKRAKLKAKKKAEREGLSSPVPPPAAASSITPAPVSPIIPAPVSMTPPASVSPAPTVSTSATPLPTTTYLLPPIEIPSPAPPTAPSEPPVPIEAPPAYGTDNKAVQATPDTALAACPTCGSYIKVPATESTHVSVKPLPKVDELEKETSPQAPEQPTEALHQHEEQPVISALELTLNGSNDPKRGPSPSTTPQEKEGGGKKKTRNQLRKAAEKRKKEDAQKQAGAGQQGGGATQAEAGAIKPAEGPKVRETIYLKDGLMMCVCTNRTINALCDNYLRPVPDYLMHVLRKWLHSPEDWAACPAQQVVIEMEDKDELPPRHPTYDEVMALVNWDTSAPEGPVAKIIVDQYMFALDKLVKSRNVMLSDTTFFDHLLDKWDKRLGRAPKLDNSPYSAYELNGFDRFVFPVFYQEGWYAIMIDPVVQYCIVYDPSCQFLVNHKHLDDILLLLGGHMFGDDEEDDHLMSTHIVLPGRPVPQSMAPLLIGQACELMALNERKDDAWMMNALEFLSEMIPTSGLSKDMFSVLNTLERRVHSTQCHNWRANGWQYCRNPTCLVHAYDYCGPIQKTASRYPRDISDPHYTYKYISMDVMKKPGQSGKKIPAIVHVSLMDMDEWRQKTVLKVRRYKEVPCVPPQPPLDAALLDPTRGMFQRLIMRTVWGIATHDIAAPSHTHECDHKCWCQRPEESGGPVPDDAAQFLQLHLEVVKKDGDGDGCDRAV